MENSIDSLYDDLSRLGVCIEGLQGCNPTELQLIDLLGGLQIAHKAYAGRHDD